MTLFASREGCSGCLVDTNLVGSGLDEWAKMGKWQRMENQWHLLSKPGRGGLGAGGGRGDGQSERIRDAPRSRIRTGHRGMRETVSGPKT